MIRSQNLLLNFFISKLVMGITKDYYKTYILLF